MSGRPLRLVVMGVAGAGKSTVGERLASALGLPFEDGDTFHPPGNVAKMSRGVPLDDDDRAPWLEAVGRALAAPASGEVVACSALRRRYRDTVRRFAPDAVFVHLTADADLLGRRMAARRDHFMPPELLTSQFATLEPLELDEDGFEVDNRLPLEQVVESIARDLSVRATALGHHTTKEGVR